MTTSRTLLGASGFLMIVALATPGCATKKFVRQQVGTVDQRVSDVDKKQSDALSNLDSKQQKDISRVDERAMSAENKANDAARAAQAADQKASQAGDTARGANDLAQQAHSRIGDVQHAVENIDTLKVLTTQDVLFAFNKATLTTEGKEKLDSIIQQAQGMPRYVVEVEGFTDRTGPQDYNLMLSRRRADTVVRYLIDHGVPLRRVRDIGLGETQKKVAEANTKMTRKEMRRVVVNLYVPEAPVSASSAMPQSQQAPQSAPSQTQQQQPQPVSPR